MYIQRPETQNCPYPGTRLTMIRLYTLQRFAHFSPQDSIASVDISHCMVFEKRMTETQSFRNINSLVRADHTNLHPSTSWSTSSRAHATYSTMLEPIIACGCTRKFLAWKYLSSRWAWVADLRIITRVLRDIPGQHWILQVPNKQSTQMCIKVATLSWTIN